MISEALGHTRLLVEAAMAPGAPAATLQALEDNRAEVHVFLNSPEWEQMAEPLAQTSEGLERIYRVMSVLVPVQEMEVGKETQALLDLLDMEERWIENRFNQELLPAMPASLQDTFRQIRSDGRILTGIQVAQSCTAITFMVSRSRRRGGPLAVALDDVAGQTALPQREAVDQIAAVALLEEDVAARLLPWLAAWSAHQDDLFDEYRATLLPGVLSLSWTGIRDSTPLTYPR
jgi:hypothetical protein